MRKVAAIALLGSLVTLAACSESVENASSETVDEAMAGEGAIDAYAESADDAAAESADAAAESADAAVEGAEAGAEAAPAEAQPDDGDPPAAE